MEKNQPSAKEPRRSRNQTIAVSELVYPYIEIKEIAQGQKQKFLQSNKMALNTSRDLQTAEKSSLHTDLKGHGF